MPHFEANKILILKEKDVPAGHTLEGIYKAMENKQFPLKIKRGAVTYEVGMLNRVYLGRDAIVGDIGLDPEFNLIVDIEIVPIEGEDEISVLDGTPVTVVKYLEWGI